MYVKLCRIFIEQNFANRFNIVASYLLFLLKLKKKKDVQNQFDKKIK